MLRVDIDLSGASAAQKSQFVDDLGAIRNLAGIQAAFTAAPAAEANAFRNAVALEPVDEPGTNWASRIVTTDTVSTSPAAIFLGGIYKDDGTDVGTEHVAIELGEFTAVQLIFRNKEHAPLHIIGASVLSAADFTDKTQDLAFSTAATPVTFSGTLSTDVTADSDLFFSDVIPLASVKRTDNGDPVLYARIAYSLPDGEASSLSTWENNGANWTTGHKQWWQAGVYGDRRMIALDRTPGPTGRRTLVGVRYLSPTKAMTVLSVGATNPANTRQPNWMQLAAPQAEVINLTSSEQLNALSTTPTHVLYHVRHDGSGETAWGAEATNAIFADLVNVLQYGRERGLKCGIVGAPPRNSLTVASDARRKAFLARIAPLAEFVDLSVVGDAQNPQQWLPALSDDGIAPNEAGEQIIVAAVAELIEKWSGRYF